MTWTATDFQFMSRALQLAKRGRYTCDPNPLVGCVLVKDAKVIAEGWHVRAGEGHAEVEALKKTNEAQGSTAYVTLEPCSHTGKTPPCVDALIKANVSRVVIAMTDPNPLVAGKGLKALSEAGIKVEMGLLSSEAEKLNPGFIKRMTLGLPYVICKSAMSLDGRTALENGDSQWISSVEARRDVHKLRAGVSAILSSAKSVIKDNARLTVRDFSGDFKAPVRVILDRRAVLTGTENIFAESGKVIIYSESMNSQLTNNGIEAIQINPSDSWLNDVLTHLAKVFEINTVLVEAGATLSGELFQQTLVDEFIIYMAAKILGQDAQALVAIPKLENLDNAIQFDITELMQIGSDVRFKLKPKK